MARKALRFCDSFCAEERLQGGLRVPSRVRRVRARGQSRHCLLSTFRRLVKQSRQQIGPQELYVLGLPAASSGASVYAVEPKFGLLLLHHLREEKVSKLNIKPIIDMKTNSAS